MNTFEDWLKRQQQRDDLVGHLAKGVMTFTGRPKRSASYEDWIAFLSQAPNGYEAFDAFKQAWEEYAVETRSLIRIQVISETREYGQFVEIEIYASNETMARAAAKALALSYDDSDIVAVYIDNPLQRIAL